MTFNLYQILDTPPYASQQTITKAYQTKLAFYKQNTVPSDPIFNRLYWTYKILSDQESRSEYDQIKDTSDGKELNVFLKKYIHDRGSEQNADFTDFAINILGDLFSNIDIDL